MSDDPAVLPPLVPAAKSLTKEEIRASCGPVLLLARWFVARTASVKDDQIVRLLEAVLRDDAILDAAVALLSSAP